MTAMIVLAVALLLTLTCQVTLAFPTQNHSSTEDPHGGVPMGVPNSFCDDGKSFISIDWDPSSTKEYTCDGDIDLDVNKNSYTTCEDQAKRPIHVCYPQTIEYDEDIPTSGRHRPLWPKYGEYRYLPPQRWLHSLEHGAIVFLYHPCADPTQIKKFKAIAKECLRRHIISPSKRIPLPNMFAVASWKCKLVTTHPDIAEIVDFVRDHALHSPEFSVYKNGQYSQDLTHPAQLVSDMNESRLCPDMSLMAQTTKKLVSRSFQRIIGLQQMRREAESQMNTDISRWRHMLELELP